MMGSLKFFALFAMLFACSFAASSGTTGFDEKLVTRQAEPCVRCCRLQRRFNRMVMNFEEAEADLTAARNAFIEARTELEDAQTALSENADQIATLKRGMLDRRVEVNRILADIDDGGNTQEERRALRAQLRTLRAEIRTIRTELAEAREEKAELALVIEDTASEVADRRQDRNDERQMFLRARNRRDGSETRLERCLNRGMMTPSPEPSMEPTDEPVDPTMAPTAEPMGPTVEPTADPIEPTMTPAVEPMMTPAVEPMMTPAVEPMVSPAVEPMVSPEEELEESSEA